MSNIKEPSKSPRDNHREKLHTFMRKLKHSINLGNSFKRKANIKVKYFFEVSKLEKKSSIELKIGENKLYVVKNMRSFIHSIRNRETMDFGKNFLYNPSLYEFKGQDKNIIALLTELYDANNLALHEEKNTSLIYKILKGKRAYLSASYVKRLFSYLIGKKIDLNIYGLEYNDVEVVFDEMPLEFDIKEMDGDINISQKDKMALPLIYEGGIFYFKGKVYITTDRQNELYKYFYNMIVEEKGIIFEEEDLNNVGTYVIPLLQSISSEIFLDDNIKHRFHDFELIPNVYLDKEGNNIIVSLRYEYGDISINPLRSLEDQYKSKLIIRDIKKERKVEKILEAYGFEEHGFNLILKDDEEILFFIKEGLDKLQLEAKVFYSDEFKKIRINKSPNIKSSLDIKNNFLELDFNIEGVESSELLSIFQDLKEKRKYYRLKNGAFLDLSSDGMEELYGILELLDIKEFNEDKIVLDKFNAMYLEDKLENNDFIENENNEYFEKFISNIKNFDEKNFKLQSNLSDIMRSYQKTGFNWMKSLAFYGFGGVLADEMGLGKTLQAISLMTSLEEGEENGPSLVVCPTSLIYNWKYEIEKFAPNLKVLVVMGNKEVRDELIQNISMEKFDVIITSYGLIRRDSEDYNHIEFKYCFLDEAQNIKNYNSQSAKAVKLIRAKSRFALTGTPIENSLTELWSIFDYILPGYLLSHGKFINKYEKPIVKEENMEVLEEFNRHIQPFILRRLKSEVVKELPPKIEHKIMVEMTEEQKLIYAAYVNMYKEQLDREISTNGFKKSKFKILSALTKLRQICCHPSIILEDYNGESGKFKALEEVLEESLEGNHRVLIFSQFTTVLKSISKVLENKGIKHYYLDGSTQSEKRLEMVSEFNNNDVPVFLISLKAGGTGLNLTGADVVIHFDPWWNPAVESQATDRSHRIGQRKTVEVIKLITKGTIEEKIYELQERKKLIVSNVMDNVNKEFLWEINEDDLDELFKL